MQGERVLVTGGAGFIGSNLAEALAEENDVMILDDLSTGMMENIKDLKKKNNVQFIKGNITDDRLLHKCFTNIDYVFHQAALPSVPRSIIYPQSSVFGDTPSLPKIEDMPVDGHQSRASGGRTHVCPAEHTWICERAEEPGYHSKVITAGTAVNDYMPLHVVELLVCKRTEPSPNNGTQMPRMTLMHTDLSSMMHNLYNIIYKFSGAQYVPHATSHQQKQTSNEIDSFHPHRSPSSQEALIFPASGQQSLCTTEN